MEDKIDTIKALGIGFALGCVIGAYAGYYLGRRMEKDAIRPEFRVIVASVILAIWALAQIVSLVFGTQVDGWLNAIMGMVAGFFFGDGIVESLKQNKK